MRNFLAALALLVAGTAQAAPVRYDYLGPEFTGFTDVPEVPGSYSPSMRVSGYFVVEEALPFIGLNLQVIAIADMLDFSFTDGRNTITGAQTNLPTAISVATDTNGDIFLWNINLSTSFDQPEPGGEQSWQIWTRTNFGGGSNIDSAFTSVCVSVVGGGPCLFSYDDSAVAGGSGVWTTTVVPIPAAVWLFGSALAMLGFGARFNDGRLSVGTKSD